MDYCETSIRQLCALYYEAKEKQLIQLATPIQKQVLSATKTTDTRIVLTAWPNRLETRLEDDEMGYAIISRLGIGLPQLLGYQKDSHIEPCLACSKGQDGERQNGTRNAAHMAQCPYTRIRRHNKVAFTVMQAMNAAGIIATRERQLPGTQHSADIWATNPLPTHPNDQYFLIDVTICQAYSSRNEALPNTAMTLRAAHKRKIQKYKNIANQTNAHVQPIAMSTYGAMHQGTTDFLKRLAIIAEANGTYFPDLDNDFVLQWRRNIAFQLARATAKAVFDTATKHNYNALLLGP